MTGTQRLFLNHESHRIGGHRILHGLTLGADHYKGFLDVQTLELIQDMANDRFTA
jgi:hypothetical protein